MALMVTEDFTEPPLCAIAEDGASDGLHGCNYTNARCLIDEGCGCWNRALFPPHHIGATIDSATLLPDAANVRWTTQVLLGSEAHDIAKRCAERARTCRD